MQHPKVSVIIPVYNGSNYLSDAINSALSQTYSNLEIIIVNDGSNDNGKTKEIALSYGNKIKYIEKENGGVSSALNIGIKNMTGEYFSWLSHDDIYYPNKIEESIKFIKNDKQIVYSDYDLLYQNKSKIIKHKCKKIKFKYDPLINIDLNGITMLIKKTHLLEVGLFDEKMKYSQDYDLWFKLLKKYEFIHIGKSLAISRIHHEQDSNNILSQKEGKEFWKKTIIEIERQKIYNKNKLLLKVTNNLYYACPCLIDELLSILNCNFTTKLLIIIKILVLKCKHLMNQIHKGYKYLIRNGIKKTLFQIYIVKEKGRK